ncbi:hypothetical protein STENM223S_02220 [Streptomyces tendae]
MYCPGCGGLRSAHAVVHGDLAAALQANAPAVLGYAAFAVLWTVWVIRAARGRPVRVALGPVHLWTLGTLLLVFTVVRNLPSGGWLTLEQPRDVQVVGLSSAGCGTGARLRIPSQ